MPICTYMSNHEKMRLKSVSDKDINEILDELRKLGDDTLLIQQFLFTTKKWFCKPVTEIFYSLYIDYAPNGYGEVQIFNFAVNEDESSINTTVRKADILNYLIGYRNGLLEKKK